jgi:hypothetical protein
MPTQAQSSARHQTFRLGRWIVSEAVRESSNLLGFGSVRPGMRVPAALVVARRAAERGWHARRGSDRRNLTGERLHSLPLQRIVVTCATTRPGSANSGAALVDTWAERLARPLATLQPPRHQSRHALDRGQCWRQASPRCPIQVATALAPEPVVSVVPSQASPSNSRRSGHPSSRRSGHPS